MQLIHFASADRQLVSRLRQRTASAPAACGATTHQTASTLLLRRAAGTLRRVRSTLEPVSASQPLFHVVAYGIVMVLSAHARVEADLVAGALLDGVVVGDVVCRVGVAPTAAIREAIEATAVEGGAVLASIVALIPRQGRIVIDAIALHHGRLLLVRVGVLSTGPGWAGQIAVVGGKSPTGFARGTLDLDHGSRHVGGRLAGGWLASKSAWDRGRQCSAGGSRSAVLLYLGMNASIRCGIFGSPLAAFWKSDRILYSNHRIPPDHRSLVPLGRRKESTSRSALLIMQSTPSPVRPGPVPSGRPERLTSDSAAGAIPFAAHHQGPQ
ncbi:hypothetical protein KC361_g145 [Hortaea werneckii]|nr:hypothetical protein KC361_g145 [Hortaea werneckii]